MFTFILALKNRIPLSFLLGLLVFILSIILIAYHLSVPQAVVFDETYHIPSAQKYLNGVFFQENHPPLGKLLIAAGYYFYEEGNITNNFVEIEKIDKTWPSYLDILGYRLAPAFFGAFVPLLVYFLVRLLTGSYKLSFFISLLLLFDTAFLMQARIAMLDVFLLFFILLSLLCFFYEKFYGKREYWLLILYAFFAGCAFSVKYTGLVVAMPFFLWVMKELVRRRLRQVVMPVIVVSFVFVMTFLSFWGLHFFISKEVVSSKTYNASQEHLNTLSGENSGLAYFSNFSVRLFDSIRYHIQYNKGVPSLKAGSLEEIGSPWYQWVLGGKAIRYRWETQDGMVYRYSYLVPNIITWGISLVGVLLGTSIVVTNYFFNYLTESPFKVYLNVFVILYWSYIIPFWFIRRVMYLYHYLPGMLLGLIIFSLVFVIFETKTERSLNVILVSVAILAVLMFFLLSPFVYYLPLTDAQFKIRNLWPLWGLRCVKCT